MMEPCLQGGHFILYLATRQGTARGGMDRMYAAVQLQQDQQATAEPAAPITADLGLEGRDAQEGVGLANGLLGPAEGETVAQWKRDLLPVVM